MAKKSSGTKSPRKADGPGKLPPKATKVSGPKCTSSSAAMQH